MGAHLIMNLSSLPLSSFLSTKYRIVKDVKFTNTFDSRRLASKDTPVGWFDKERQRTGGLDAEQEVLILVFVGNG